MPVKIFFNEEITLLPKDVVNIADLLGWKNIKSVSTAVSVNNQIVKKDQWNNQRLKDGDNVIVFSAAFGG